MTYTNKELINARIEAHHIAEKLVVAYWVDEERRLYHISEAIKSFENLARNLGYDIKIQEPADLVEVKK
jgi:hypothetical protein